MAGSPCPVKSMNECVEKMHMTEVTNVLRADGIVARNDPDQV